MKKITSYLPFFILLLLPLFFHSATFTTERIRTEFKKEMFSPAAGKDVHVTVSIGLGQYKSQEDMKAFVHRVDQFMPSKEEWERQDLL